MWQIKRQNQGEHLASSSVRHDLLQSNGGSDNSGNNTVITYPGTDGAGLPQSSHRPLQTRPTEISQSSVQMWTPGCSCWHNLN